MYVFSVHSMLNTISRLSRDDQLLLFRELQAKLHAEGSLFGTCDAAARDAFGRLVGGITVTE